jgi:hypothetical protein
MMMTVARTAIVTSIGAMSVAGAVVIGCGAAAGISVASRSRALSGADIVQLGAQHAIDDIAAVFDCPTQHIADAGTAVASNASASMIAANRFVVRMLTESIYELENHCTVR